MALWATVALVLLTAALWGAAWWSVWHERSRAARLVGLAPAWLTVGLALGSSATAARWLGDWAPLGAIALSLAVAAVLPRRFPRLVAAFVAVVAWAALIKLRAHTAGPLPVLLAVAALLATTGAAPISPVSRARLFGAAVAGTLACAVALSLAGANLRQVTLAQTQLTARLLRPLSRAPRLSSPSQPATASGSPLDALGADAPGLGAAHLVLITVDAQRADHPPTPGDNAVIFRQAYAAVPHTSLSLVSLMTGAQPAALGDTRTIAEELDAQRWETLAFYPAGLFFDARRRLERYAARRLGFAWTDTRTLDAASLTGAVIARLDELQAAGEPRTLLWVHYFDAHAPYEGSGTAVERYTGELRATERGAARLIDRLRKLSRPSLVVMTADHGEEFGEHGGAYHGTTLYDEQLRVPLRFFTVGAPPLRAPITDAPVQLIDVLPRALDLLGVGKRPPSLATRPAATDVLAELESLRMLRRGRYKIIRELRGELDELYDLDADPRERHNLAGERPQVVAELAAALYGSLSMRTTAELIDAAQICSTGCAATVRALGERQSPTARATLVALLARPDDDVRAEAALALAELDDDAGRAILRTLLDRPAGDAKRARAALALGRLRDTTAAPELVRLTRHIDVGWRRHAVHYLGHVGGADTWPLLIDLAASDERVSNEAYRSVARIAQRLRITQPAETAAAMAALARAFAAESRQDVRLDLATALRALSQ
jgi:hypothetical protein